MYISVVPRFSCLSDIWVSRPPIVIKIYYYNYVSINIIYMYMYIHCTRTIKNLVQVLHLMRDKKAAMIQS